jgi:hypothetical protein
MLLKQIKANVSPIFGFFILLLSKEEIITATEAAGKSLINIYNEFCNS